MGNILFTVGMLGGAGLLLFCGLPGLLMLQYERRAGRAMQAEKSAGMNAQVRAGQFGIDASKLGGGNGI